MGYVTNYNVQLGNITYILDSITQKQAHPNFIANIL